MVFMSKCQGTFFDISLRPLTFLQLDYQTHMNGGWLNEATKYVRSHLGGAGTLNTDGSFTKISFVTNCLAFLKVFKVSWGLRVSERFVTTCTSAMDRTRRHMLSPSSGCCPQNGYAHSSRRWNPVMRVYCAPMSEDRHQVMKNAFMSSSWPSSERT